MAQASGAENEHKQEKVDNSIKFVLKCNNNCRNHGLSLLPESNSRLYNIVKIVTDQYSGGHKGVTPHMHLIYPFLPKDVLVDAYEIINHCIQDQDIQPLIVCFNDIIRTHGSGKQYCYLVCDNQSKQRLIKLQKNIMNGLCLALKNGNIGNEKKNNKKNVKKKKKKGKHKRININIEVEDYKTCLENDIRNIEFNPHLTLGQWDEKEYKTMRHMILSAFQENENENKSYKTTNDKTEEMQSEQELFHNILKFKVDNLYIVNVKNGMHRIVKSIVLSKPLL